MQFTDGTIYKMVDDQTTKDTLSEFVVLAQNRSVVHLPCIEDAQCRELKPLYCVSSMHGNCSYIWRKSGVEPPLKDADVFYSSPIAYPAEPGEYICEIISRKHAIFSAKVSVKRIGECII